MKPDTISSTAPTPARAAWRDMPPVHEGGVVYTVDDMYEHGLAGTALAQTAHACGVRVAELRDVLAAYPYLKAAYDDGWADRESDALRRAEVSLSEQAEGYWREVERVAVHKGVLTRYKERVFFPGSPVAATTLLERRDRARWGKDVRPESPTLALEAMARVSLYLESKGHGPVAGIAAPTPAAGDAP